MDRTRAPPRRRPRDLDDIDRAQRVALHGTERDAARETDDQDVPGIGMQQEGKVADRSCVLMSPPVEASVFAIDLQRLHAGRAAAHRNQGRAVLPREKDLAARADKVAQAGASSEADR